MRSALIGATAVAAAAFVTPALAQDLVSPARYCAQSYPDGYCAITGYAAGRDYRDDESRNGTAMQALQNNAYRYHGGPKFND